MLSLVREFHWFVVNVVRSLGRYFRSVLRDDPAIPRETAIERNRAYASFERDFNVQGVDAITTRRCQSVSLVDDLE